jgi:hypothetical protein
MKKLITLLALTFYFNVNAQIIRTIAGDSIGGYVGDGGLSYNAELNNPYGVVTDQYRNLYIADMNNSRVRMVTTSTGIITTIAGSGTFGYTGDGFPATAAQLSTPYGVALDASGNVYIADYDNFVVRQVVASTGLINTIAGNNNLGGGYTGDNGPATAATLGGAMGVAVDASGNLYIADYNNNCIRIVNPAGTINTFAGNGTAGYGGDGGAANSAQLNKPTGVSVDALGNVYIADYGNNVIRMVNPSGTISTVAGNNAAGAGYAGNGGPATSAQLFNPWNITTGSGNLYIADYGNNVIRKVNSLGIISTIVGNGTQGYMGDCANPTAAELNNPAGIALDSYGNLYIADNGNNGIRKVLFTASQTHVTAHATKTTICSGEPITFTGGGASTYTWTNGIVNATPYLIPTITASVSAIYTVTGTDTNQCMNAATIAITEYPLPTVSANGDTICAGQYATLSGVMITVYSGTIVPTYAWTNGVVNGVPFMPSVSSNYVVTGTDGNGCSNTGTATIIVLQTTNPLPVISISSSAPISTCGGSSTLTASGASTYIWNTGQSGSNVVVTPTVSTTYSVTGTAFGCKATATITQVVNAVNIMSSVDSLCLGSSATLTANTAITLASNQYVTYNWGISTSSLHSAGVVITPSPTVTTNDTVTGTIYTITTPTTGINDTSRCLSRYIYTQIVRVLSTSSSTDSLCNGSSTTLMANGASASSYTWNPGNQNGASIVVSPTVTTTYTVTGTAQTCVVTNTITQIVKPPLDITVTSNMDSVCVGGGVTLTASGAISYIWNSNPPQAGTSIVVTPMLTTTYVVNGTSYGCSAIANFVQKVDSTCFTGIKQLANQANQQILIYPNPAANGLFTVSTNENSESASIVVLNSLGQKVFETKSTGQKTQISLPNCLSGIYYVQISNGSTTGTSVKKLIVE